MTFWLNERIIHLLTIKKGLKMALEFLTKNLKFKISQLSQDELEEEFELYKSLQARSVRDEIYQELLAQELDRREQEEYDYE